MFHIAGHTSEHIIVNTCDPHTKQCIRECTILPTVLGDLIYDYTNYTFNIIYFAKWNQCVVTNTSIARYYFEFSDEIINDQATSLSCDLFIHNEEQKIHCFAIRTISNNCAIIADKICEPFSLLNLFTEKYHNRHYFDSKTCVESSDKVCTIDDKLELVMHDECIQIVDKETLMHVIMLISSLINYTLIQQKIDIVNC